MDKERFFKWITGEDKYISYSNEFDESLSTKMEALLRIISLARQARKNTQLKIRQPLAEIIVITTDNIEYKAIQLFEKDFLEELNVKKVTVIFKGETSF